jgi:hypothetical protein
MTDGDSLRHLLDSPLEERSNRPTRTETADSAGRLWVVGAMLVGGLIVLGGYLVGGRESTPAAGESTTTTTTQPASTTGFPTGFTPLDSRFGARAERVLFSPAGVYVTVSTVSTHSIEGEASAFVGGSWDLVLTDGTRLSSVDQATDALVPGYLTVRFDPTGYGPDEVASIEYTALAVTAIDEATLNIPTISLPENGATLTLDDMLEHTTPDGTGLIIRDIELSTLGGSATWALASDGPTRAKLSASLLATDEGGVHHFTAITGQEAFFGGFGFGSFAILHGAWQERGDMSFAIQNDAVPLPSGVPVDFQLRIQFTWVSFAPVDAPPIPIGDAPVVVVE